LAARKSEIVSPLFIKKECKNKSLVMYSLPGILVLWIII